MPPSNVIEDVHVPRVQGERKRSMLERVTAEDDALDHRRDDSMDTQDSIHGAAAIPAAGDIVLPSSLARRVDESRASSSAESKPITDASTLPIRGVRSPPGAVHQLLAAGPADSVRDTAGKPVRKPNIYTVEYIYSLAQQSGSNKMKIGKEQEISKC